VAKSFFAYRVFAFLSFDKNTRKKQSRALPCTRCAPDGFLRAVGVLLFYKRDAEGATRAPSAGGLFFASAFLPHHGCVVGEAVSNHLSMMQKEIVPHEGNNNRMGVVKEGEGCGECRGIH